MVLQVVFAGFIIKGAVENIALILRIKFITIEFFLRNSLCLLIDFINPVL